MRQYIQNLTDNLTGKNRYDEIWERIQNADEFLKHIKTDLEIGDVRDMNPETLGKIMCSLETGDVMASKDDLFKGVHFGGDCGEMLREMVALSLAYVIRNRVDRSTRDSSYFPAYHRRVAVK